MTKMVAETLKGILGTEQMTAILDRSQDITHVAGTLKDHWSYDLYSRKPGPAIIENAILKPTDLDLACFMSALVDRKAVINLPQYEGRRPRTRREGEMVISDKNRHGRILGLISNRNVFSFSILVNDANVIIQDETGEGEVGGYRCFMLVDLDGKWHSGWQKIEFIPTAKENFFLEEKGIWTGNEIYFKNFVHPARWAAMYGQYYFMSKAAIQRMEEEATHYRAVKKQLLEAGITFPKTGEGAKTEWGESTTEKGESKKFEAFEAEVDVPMVGEYADKPHTQAGLILIDRHIHHIQYDLLPPLRFATRAVELAFRNAGHMGQKMPAWIRNAEWEEGYVPTGTRTKWNRLVLHQERPGQLGLAIRYRIYEKSERVAK